jgi:hypothetical protein
MRKPRNLVFQAGFLNNILKMAVIKRIGGRKFEKNTKKFLTGCRYRNRIIYECWVRLGHFTAQSERVS